MKRSFIMLCCMTCLMACADEKKVIEFNALPQVAQTTLTTYAQPQAIILVTQEGINVFTEYEVKMNDQSEWEFDAKGNVTSVEVAAGVPQALVPSAIMQYISKMYPTAIVVKYSQDRNEQEAKLDSGVELTFNKKGELIKTDLH